MYPSNFGVRSRRMYEFRPAAAVRADAELVVAFRAADDDAIRSLVARYGGLVYRIASEVSPVATAHDPSAADLTVHTFLQAWRNAEVFEPGRAFGPWLASLAVRVVGAEDSGVAPEAQAPDVEGLLADRSSWTDPPADVADRVVAAILAEATVGPAELYTAADLRAAQESARGRASARPFVVGAIAAVGLLLLGVLVFSALGGADVETGDTIDLRPTGRVPDVSGSIEVITTEAGVRIVLNAPTLPDPGTGWYEGWVQLDDGSIRSAGTFSSADGVELTAAVDVAGADQFLVVLADDDPSAFTDTDVVLRAPLS